MQAKNILPLLLVFLTVSLFSQSNIQQSLSVNSSGAAADVSAQLDVSATDKGMLVPRMTTAQRTAIVTPATGLLVFDTDTGGFWFYNGIAWTNLSAPKTLADADNDTKVQVEESPDEDIIRFDLAGTENMVLRKNAGGFSRLEFPNVLDNTFIGLNAGSANTTGGVNTALGMQALFNNTEGVANTATGWWTLFNNTTGIQNTSNGATALYFNTTGMQNTGVGREALFNNNTGNGNTAIGRRALRFNTVGSNNTAVGHDADVLSNNLTNATAIGYNARVGASNSLVLGGTGANSVNVGIGTTTPSYRLHVSSSGYGFMQTSGPISMGAFVDSVYTPLGGWFGTQSNHPLFFFTSDAAEPQMALVQSGSVGIGTYTPNSSALLDLTSTDKGMLVPRMTTAQRTAIASPATGLLVYDNDTNAFWFYNGTAWAAIGGGGVSTLIADADNDTKVQVEKSPDEDIIRFDLAGTENMVLRKNAGGSPRLELPNPLHNTFIGVDAGSATTTGNRNIAIGVQALYSNTSGKDNTANGYQALYSNTSGFYNTANGHQALANNNDGILNTATGSLSLWSNTSGDYNTASGYNALFSNTTGSKNTALGYNANVTANNLTNATAIGYNAKVGASNSLVLGGIGADVVKVGIGTTTPNASALLDLTSTDKGMLVPRMTSAQRTAIATPATGLLVYDNDTNAFWFYNGTAWTRISPQTLLADADNDTKVQVEESPDEDIIRFDVGGTEGMVLRKNSSGLHRLELPNPLNNTFIGVNAGSSNTTSPGGGENVAVGRNALLSNTLGFRNTAIGSEALKTNTSGNYNIAIGSLALESNHDGHNNTAIGTQALQFNSSGWYNVAIGAQALQVNSNGWRNTATGYQALTNTIGSDNTATGYQALLGNQAGNSNTAHGNLALKQNNGGSNNTGLGDRALFTNTSGSNNTAVGKDADVLLNNLTNATAIGYQASVNASDKVRIGNGSVTLIEGQVDWSFPSDARFKFNIHDDAVPGLAFIEKLRPVTYQFDTRKFDQHLMQNMPDSVQQRRMAGQDYSKSSAIVQTGFLAQEVEQICKDLDYDFSGLHVPESEVDNYGLAYGSFVPLLVKAVQEQQKIIENGKWRMESGELRIEHLEKENAAKDAEINALKSQLEKITAALAEAGIAVEK